MKLRIRKKLLESTKYSAIEFMDMLGLLKTMKKFCVFGQNERSLRRNGNLLVENLSENKLSPSVIALSEILHSDDTSFVKISGYQGLFASNHKTKARGVALFVDQKIQVQVKNKSFCSDILVFHLFLPSSQKFSVIVIYNSPSNSWEFFCRISENCWKRIRSCIHVRL